MKEISLQKREELLGNVPFPTQKKAVPVPVRVTEEKPRSSKSSLSTFNVGSACKAADSKSLKK